MRRSRPQRTCAIVLMVFAAMGVAAQDKPDFSGRWILATPRPAVADVPLALSVRQALVRTTVRGDPMPPFFRDIDIEREFATGIRHEHHTIGVVGGVVSGTVGGGRSATSHHAVRWEGNDLAFEQGTHTGPRRESGVWTERREVWSLDADGRLRVAIDTRSSEAGSSTITLHYRRP